jgi:hypothetical protein
VPGARVVAPSLARWLTLQPAHGDERHGKKRDIPPCVVLIGLDASLKARYRRGLGQGVTALGSKRLMGHSPAGGALADIGRRGAQSNAKSAVQAFVGQVAFELLRQKHDDARTKSRRIGFAAEAHTVVGYR